MKTVENGAADATEMLPLMEIWAFLLRERKNKEMLSGTKTNTWRGKQPWQKVRWVTGSLGFK